MTVCIVDTSIFCNLLSVPNRCQQRGAVFAQFREKTKANETLLLPMTTILETGNHIGQNGDGNARRHAAMRFTEQVKLALDGQSPFTPTRFLTRDSLAKWLDEFPKWTLQGSGFGDLSIVKDYEHQCALSPGHRVYIWSLDEHLASYDRPPEM
ncbi:hypothetical protein JY651_38905 [Pyxidicoccus parkwayensis]|uniref:PIN domain-containing protein n=1 Tax=Pyxidicoccus parkwayensis TaxID=2813578 RepID=A0ABX7NRQ6_9BACT|nr:hypothetical protein [Pyxidicoccus parkwaysis]QSQ21118.1 hypothetical protein JY651_38905 [Pyxidicoccus parkwaysis]